MAIYIKFNCRLHKITDALYKLLESVVAVPSLIPVPNNILSKRFKDKKYVVPHIQLTGDDLNQRASLRSPILHDGQLLICNCSVKYDINRRTSVCWN